MGIEQLFASLTLASSLTVREAPQPPRPNNTPYKAAIVYETPLPARRYQLSDSVKLDAS